MMKRMIQRGLLFITVSGLLFAGCAVAPEVAPPKPPMKPPPPPVSPFSSLSDLTDTFSQDLSKDVIGKRIYLDSTAIRDIATKDVSNFSAHLQQELESSFSKSGFVMIYDPSEADYLIGAVYRKDQETVRIFFKYHKADFSGRKSLDYEIEVSRLPHDSFTENIRAKAYRLAANILMDQNDLKIYIKPIKEGNDEYVSDFSNSFTSRIKTEMVRLRRDITILDEKPIYEKLSDTINIEKKAKEVKNLKTSEALFCGADTIFEGEYFIGRDEVTINCYLKDLQGRVLNSSTVDVHQKLIVSSLKNPVEEQITIIDKPSEKGDFNVRISTTKGGDFPVYYDGEKIKFYMQVATPLYVYLYNINPYQEVTLLYPYERHMRQQQLLPGRIYTIPAETDDFEFEVKSPFGTDGVKIFACPVELPIPEFNNALHSVSFRGNTRTLGKIRKEAQQELSNRLRINPKDLVDYYMGVAQRFGAEIYADSLYVKTQR